MVKVLDMVTGEEVKLPVKEKGVSALIWKIEEDKPAKSKVAPLGSFFSHIADTLSLE